MDWYVLQFAAYYIYTVYIQQNLVQIYCIYTLQVTYLLLILNIKFNLYKIYNFREKKMLFFPFFYYRSCLMSFIFIKKLVENYSKL